MAVQNLLVQNNRPKFQSFDRVKAPAGGQAGATRRCRRVGQDCLICTVCRGLQNVVLIAEILQRPYVRVTRDRIGKERTSLISRDDEFY